MAAAFLDPAILQHQNLVRHFKADQSVRNKQSGTALHERAYRRRL